MKTCRLLLFFSLLLFWSCSTTDEPVIPVLEISTQKIDFSAENSSRELVIKTNLPEDVIIEESEDSWAHCTLEDSKLVVSVDENPNQAKRAIQFKLKLASIERNIKIRQLGSDADILVSQEMFTVADTGEEISFTVTANVDFEFQAPEWINEVVATKAADFVETTHQFKVMMNAEEEERAGEIVIQATNSDVEKVVMVNQAVAGEYQAGELPSLKDNIEVPVSRATSSCEQPGQGIDKSIDNDSTTIYHSKWDNSADDYFPITLTYYFDDVETIDYFVYHPRISGWNGHFKEVTVQYQTADNSEFVDYKDFNFNGTGTPKTVWFDNTLEHPTAIRLIVKSGAGDNGGFASCSEMKFFKRNPANFDYHTLFTDKTCSELKAGITEQEIGDCSFAFYKNLAYHLYTGKYNSEFRIQEYKAYPHPTVQSRINKTYPYSVLDNPTGIRIEEEEPIVVFVGDTKGCDISLKVQNLDTPGADGFGGPEYKLREGYNKIIPSSKGLMYVLYNTEDENAPNVKIHIASGEVNGYFDVAKHSADEWTERLNNTTDKFFDVLGEHAHLTFPVSRFKEFTPDGKALIDVFDEIVRLEQDFMGLYKYNKVPKNRMYLHVVYKDFMYANYYHTAYHDNTLHDLCDVDKLKTTSIWGPSHELGHCNQTSPGFKWTGMTEVTNNIHSLYVQTSFGNPSRIQAENLMGYDGYNNRYEKAMNAMFVDHPAFANIGDVFCNLVPFWQLQLYMAKVLGQEDFYKDIYENVRTTENLSASGDNQLEFVYRCCLISQLDLTDFFEAWGFFKPIDQIINDYGEAQLLVTSDAVKAMKDKIAQLNLPKPEADFQYICDNSVEIFKSASAIVKGTATHEGRKFTMSDWENVVAYQLYVDGQLKFVTTESSFTTKFDIDADFEVYALNTKGEKVKVDF